MPRPVADDHLREAVHARAIRIAQTMGAPLAAVLVDVVEHEDDGGRASLIGDVDGLLLHVVAARCAVTERQGYVEGRLAERVSAALAPFAVA